MKKKIFNLGIIFMLVFGFCFNSAICAEAQELQSEKISFYGIYVLKQGVSEDLDITKPTNASYWTKIDYPTAELSASLGEGSLLTVNTPNYNCAKITLENESKFLLALNKAVTGDVNDDTYTWKYQKVIKEAEGYHLDCIAYVPSYEISFVTNLENFQLNNLTVLRNDIIDFGLIDTNSVEGYTFQGWYSDAECTIPYGPDTKVKENIILYAKWEEIPVVEPEPEPEEDKNESVITPAPEPEVEIDTIEPSIEPDSETKEESNEEVLIEEEVKPFVEETKEEISEDAETPMVASLDETLVDIPSPEVPLAAAPISVTSSQEGISLDLSEEDNIVTIEEAEIPLASSQKESKGIGCIIHKIMYIILVIYSLCFILISFFKKKRNSKMHLTRILSSLVLLCLCVLLFFHKCYLDFYVFLIGFFICLGTFLAAKFFKEEEDDKENK